ncbi:MAG: hypothetical protein K0S41_3382 [Anaerocolumna sp.]|jgi:hypothetical protein|nr:hypothetical protein [Anaerocolumna sp.]
MKIVVRKFVVSEIKTSYTVKIHNKLRQNETLCDEKMEIYRKSILCINIK